MNYKQLLEGLKDGTVNINVNGHKSFYKDNLIASLEHNIDFWDGRESAFFKSTDEVQGNGEEYIYSLTDNFDCGKCGRKLYFDYKKENNTLNVITGKVNKKKYGIDYFKGVCPEAAKTLIPFEFEVKDTVLFTNVLRYLDDLDEKEYSDYGLEGLNSYAGRCELTRFYAAHNCGFQQTTNCSVYLFINKAKDEIIIIVDAFEDDVVNQCEYSAEKELPELGYDYLGDISCGVWRYMFINKQDLTTEDDKIDQDRIEVNLKKGRYTAYNYFDSGERNTHKIGRYNIASIIKLND